MPIKPKIGGGVKLTIQIVNFRSRHYLERCLFSISENLPSGVETEILLVNNEEASLEEIARKMKDRIDLKTHEIGKNVGFGKAHNAGFGVSRSDVILFLNPDTRILPGALQALLDVFEDQRVGITGPLLVDSAGDIQPDCFGTRRTPLSTIGRKIFSQKKYSYRADDKVFETDWVSGGAMMVRRSVFEKIGGFDENFFMYFEDVDLCLRAKNKGVSIAVNPKARIFHERGKSFSSEREKKKYYYASQDHYTRKHFGRVGAGLVKLLRFPYYLKNVYFSHRRSKFS
jgi:GT2 family glycosyltransferase